LSTNRGRVRGLGCMGCCGDRELIRWKERENCPGPKKTVQFSNYSNIFKMIRIDSIKHGLPHLEKFQVKYVFAES
jgi:hypothetical protein